MTDDITQFEQAVRRNHLNFADWAGADDAGMGDRDVVGGAVHPDGGDMVLFDARGRSGFIGIHHDNWSDVHPVKIKNAKDKGYNLRLKKIPRSVSTIDLIKRYLWITNVFLDWLHAEGSSPYAVWETPAEIDAAFRSEQKDFEHDPHLALYWVMHFGLCNDPRYALAAEQARAFGHDQTMDNMRMALAFFDATDITHDIDLTPRFPKDGKDYSKLFLRRRANLLYMTYGQSYRGGGVVAPLWQSVSLYRGRDNYAIIRMRWLCNNIAKFDLWDALEDELNDAQSDEIPFISYPRIFQPARTDTAALADALVTELMDTRPLWSNRYSAFGKAILRDIRNHIADAEAYRAAAFVIFDGDLGNPQFAEILSSLGEDGFGDEATREKLTSFEALFADMRNLLADGRDRMDEILVAADTLLSGLDRAGMAFFVGACTHRNARQVLLRHVFLTEMEDRQDHLVSLMRRSAFSDHERKAFFGKEHPDLVKAPDDEIAGAMFRVLELPDSAFEAEHKRRDAVSSASDLLRVIAHEPASFDQLTAVMQNDTEGVVTKTLLPGVFKPKSRAQHQPLDRLNTSQASELISTILIHAQRTPEPVIHSLRMLVSCAERHPETVSDPTAPHLKGLFDLIQTSPDTFLNPSQHQAFLEDVFRVFYPVAHQPAVFDLLMDYIARDDPKGAADAIFASVFTEYNYTDLPDLLPQLDAQQLERVLQSAVDSLLRTPDNPKQPLRTISACGLPAAKDWLIKTRDDTSAFSQLEPYRHRFRSVSGMLEEAIEDALEDIADQS